MAETVSRGVPFCNCRGTHDLRSTARRSVLDLVSMLAVRRKDTQMTHIFKINFDVVVSYVSCSRTVPLPTDDRRIRSQLVGRRSASNVIGTGPCEGPLGRTYDGREGSTVARPYG
jgi:hypothetical protein